MSTTGLGKETADTRVMMPKEVYEAARHISQRELLSYSNWAARVIWRAVSEDVEGRMRLKKSLIFGTEIH